MNHTEPKKMYAWLTVTVVYVHIEFPFYDKDALYSYILLSWRLSVVLEDDRRSVSNILTSVVDSSIQCKWRFIWFYNPVVLWLCVICVASLVIRLSGHYIACYLYHFIKVYISISLLRIVPSHPYTLRGASRNQLYDCMRLLLWRRWISRWLSSKLWRRLPWVGVDGLEMVAASIVGMKDCSENGGCRLNTPGLRRLSSPLRGKISFLLLCCGCILFFYIGTNSLRLTFCFINDANMAAVRTREVGTTLAPFECWILMLCTVEIW
jgi:hypothetical protein